MTYRYRYEGRMSLGKRLRSWRKARGLTQTQAAEAAGMSQSAWAELELDAIKEIGLNTARRIVAVTCREITLDHFPRPKGRKVKPVPAEPRSGAHPIIDSALHVRAS